MKIIACVLALSIFVSGNLFAQDQTSWKKNVIDSLVSLDLPGDMDTATVSERILMGRLIYDPITVVFMRIDVLETVPLAKDINALRDGYTKTVKGYLKSSGSVIVEQKEIKQGNYIGNYLKSKLQKDGVDYFIEVVGYSLNGDYYSFQIIYPISVENASSDIQERILSSLVIAPNAKQVASASNEGR